MTLRPWSTITGGARNLYDHWRRVDPDAAAATQLAARRVFRDDGNGWVTLGLDATLSEQQERLASQFAVGALTSVPIP